VDEAAVKQLIAACEAQFVQRQELARVVHLVPLFQRLTEKETDMVRARAGLPASGWRGAARRAAAPHTLCALRSAGAATSRCPGPARVRFDYHAPVRRWRARSSCWTWRPATR
jgi:hypothetical protein